MEFVQQSRFHGELEHVNSPGVGPGLEFRLKHLSDCVRRVIFERGEKLHEKVEIAIDPTVGISASLTNVIMTDQAILSVSSFLFRWCGLVARAYTRTLHLNVVHWTCDALSPESDQALLMKHPDVALYWFRIFVSFSGTGTHALVPFRPAAPTEFHLFEQVAWAMEYFVIAHEFGHHVLGHRNINDDPMVQEFAADAFAVKISERLEFEPFPHLSNPYTRTGAGASLMLRALEILRTFEDQAGVGAVNVGTHPSSSDRIAKISKRNLMHPKQLKMDLEFNNTVVRIMNAVSAVMAEIGSTGGDTLVAQIRQKLRDAEMELSSSRGGASNSVE
jgi:hypothetical protein